MAGPCFFCSMLSSRRARSSRIVRSCTMMSYRFLAAAVKTTSRARASASCQRSIFRVRFASGILSRRIFFASQKLKAILSSFTVTRIPNLFTRSRAERHCESDAAAPFVPRMMRWSSSDLCTRSGLTLADGSSISHATLQPGPMDPRMNLGSGLLRITRCMSMLLHPSRPDACAPLHSSCNTSMTANVPPCGATGAAFCFASRT